MDSLITTEIHNNMFSSSSTLPWTLMKCPKIEKKRKKHERQKYVFPPCSIHQKEKHSCIFDGFKTRNEKIPSPIKTMLLQDSQCWVTWCVSPWKQAHWRWLAGEDDEKQVKALPQLYCKLHQVTMPTAIVFNLVKYANFPVKRRSAQCVFWRGKHSQHI